MIKIDDLIKSGTPLGIAIGVGATVLAAAVIPALPVLAKAARPGAREALKSGLLLAERGREMMSEISEEFEDILAEVRAELEREHHMTQPEPPKQDENPSDQDESLSLIHI